MRIAVVEHQTVRPFEFIRQAVDAGHEAAFVTCDLDMYLKGADPADTDLRLASQVLTPSATADADRLAEALAPVVAGPGLDAILTVSEQHTRAVAEASARLGLPHTSLKAIRATRDKFHARRRLAAAGIPQPAHRLAASLEEAVRGAEEIGYPVIIKPVDGSASLNVGVAGNRAEVTALAEPILALDGYGRSAVAARKVLIEQYMAGPVVSCETFSAGGHHLVLGITDRELTPLPDQVELAGCFPVALEEGDEIARVCRAALDAIGFDLGAAHTEIVLTPDGPRIIEINGRLAGGLMPLVMGAALNRSLYADLVDLFTQQQLPHLEPTATVAGIRSMVVDRAGKLSRIEPSPLRDAPGVVAYHIYRQVGDPVQEPRNNRDRHGAVVTTAPTVEEARALAAEVVATTRFTVEPPAAPRSVAGTAEATPA
ncbi:ATP-grasp domain-containing protein [Streptomyces sp. NPDC049577]|uniref:ATP-grasp domain-containing protein n=1 Tax=Streptomyces sp. NPDC049577 TaxID=3155153 RepID=UPI0034265603